MWIEGRAVWREAEGAAARPVTVSLDMRGLALGGLDGEPVLEWPFGRLERIAAGRESLVIGLKGTAERVEISDPIAKAEFEAALKAIPRQGQSAVPMGFLVAIAAVIGLIAVAVAILLWGLSALATYAAPLVPDEVAIMIDEAAKPSVLAGLDTGPDRVCTAPDGVAALGRLAERLADTGGGRAMRLDAEVYQSAVPNALALPGGSIVLTTALIDRAETPDALAGVVAHEIGHVHHRHGIAQLLHQGGITLAFGMLVGDPAGIAAEATRMLAGAEYSRDAEREADRFAVGAVAVAGGDARALGPLLERLQAEAGDEPAVALLSTHPISAERKADIDRLAADRTRGPGRVMSPADWQAIRTICRG